MVRIRVICGQDLKTRLSDYNLFSDLLTGTSSSVSHCGRDAEIEPHNTSVFTLDLPRTLDVVNSYQISNYRIFKIILVIFGQKRCDIFTVLNKMNLFRKYFIFSHRSSIYPKVSPLGVGL